MSLVAYGSSDESDNDEDTLEEVLPSKESQPIINKQKLNPDKNIHEKSKLNLPTAKNDFNNDINCLDSKANNQEHKVNFNLIPKPKSVFQNQSASDIVEDIDDLPSLKVNYSNIEKPPKKKRQPVKIFAPSLSQVNILIVFQLLRFYYCLFSKL